jgi:hypothetical protein
MPPVAGLVSLLFVGVAAVEKVSLPTRFTTRITGRYEHGYNTDDDPGAPELYMDVSILWAQDTTPGNVSRMRQDFDTHQRCGPDIHRFLHDTATVGDGTRVVDWDYDKQACEWRNGTAEVKALGSIYRFAPLEWTLHSKCEDRTVPDKHLGYEAVTEIFLRNDVAYDEPKEGEELKNMSVWGYRVNPCNETHNHMEHRVYVDMKENLPRKETYKYYDGWDIVTAVLSYSPFTTEFTYDADLDDLLRTPPQCPTPP